MKSRIIGLYAVSQLHAGIGSDTGVVDLPIQRERSTGYPVIRGVKGAFRHQIDLDKEKIDLIFGPETSADRAGAISFSEARILLFPVRGLKVPFYYVTCPEVLKRFKRDANLENMTIPEVEKGKALYNDEGEIYLEGIMINKVKSLPNDLPETIAKVVPDEFAEDVKRRLIVVPDELFGYLVRSTTEVVPRIKIDTKKGTVQRGGLWYEEYLPMDTVMYVVLRDRKLADVDAEALMNELIEKLNGKTITLGGKVGVGAGFVVLKAL